MARFHYRALSAICLFILSSIFSSCSKKHEIQSTSTYTFVNTLSEDVTVDIYDNQDDYYKGINALRTLKLPVYASQPVEFEALRSYWLDWYSNDYMQNNWPVSNGISLVGSPSPELKIASEDDRVGISTQNPDISRTILLNGNKLSSNWRTDISTIPTLNGTHLFTFSRDYTGQYKYVKQPGDTTTTSIRYTMSMSNGLSFQMTVFDNNSAELAFVYFNNNQYHNPNPDTIQVYFRAPGTSSYIPAWRQ